MYNSFPINVSGGELNQFFRDNIERLIGARLRGEKKLGFFILGAGVGNRESEMVRWLIYNFPEIESIRASPVAAKGFKRQQYQAVPVQSGA